VKLDRRSLFVAATAMAAGGGRASAAEHDTKPFKAIAKGSAPSARNVRGKIVYIGDENNERGREWFSYSYRKDGQITLRAYCEMDDIQVERDVTYTMDSKFRPLDCFVRLSVGGKFLGTGLIRVSDTEAECDVYNTTFGHVHQIVKTPTRATRLGAHPLANDALQMTAYDHSRSEKVQTSNDITLSSSPLLDGASGPMIGMGNTSTVEYIGPEKVTTPAGTFDTHHYRIPAIGGAAHPSGNKRYEDIWCTHPNYVFLRAEVYGYLRNKTGFGRYELTEYSEG
jgi:hypothetical protein